VIILLTHSSTAEQEEKMKERGVAQTLYTIETQKIKIICLKSGINNFGF
jgi:hypothetical protein